MESLVKALSDPVEYVRLHLMMIEEAILSDVYTRQACKALVSLSMCPVEKIGLAGQISCVPGKNMSSRSKYLLFANHPLLLLHPCTIIASEGRDAADLTAVTLNLSDIVYCRAMQNIVH